jgi:DNA-binding SARP family transcriptional activator
MRDHALDCLLTTSPWLGFPKPADRQQLIELAAANEELARYARYLVDTNSGGDIDLPHASGPWGLRVRLLGDFAVHVDGAPVPDTAWRRRKGRELFWLLCVHPKHSITRGEAADALWPEGNVDASSVRFRVALHSLREAIEPDRSAWGTRFVHSNDERIWLDPLVAVDVDDFRAAATAAPNDPTANAAERAADLYTGVLLPSGGAIDWLEPWRQELSRSWAGLALSAAEQALEQRRPGSAVPLLRSVIAEQPYEENAYRLLAAALAQTGQPGAARSVFRDCQRRLRDELALEPSWCLSDIGL